MTELAGGGKISDTFGYFDTGQLGTRVLTTKGQNAIPCRRSVSSIQTFFLAH